MAIEPTESELEFFDAYVEAIVFTELGPDSEHSPESVLDEESRRGALIDCLAFYKQNGYLLIDAHRQQAGHDFWLTRNGHGAGFWDRPTIYSPMIGELLSKRAQAFGEENPTFEELQP